MLLAWINISWSLQYWEKRKWKPGDLAIFSLIAITLAHRINYREAWGSSTSLWLFTELRGPLIDRQKGHLTVKGGGTNLCEGREKDTLRIHRRVRCTINVSLSSFHGATAAQEHTIVKQRFTEKLFFIANKQ